MLPFSRISNYGNTVINIPKIRYDFSNSMATSTGQIAGTVSGGSYLIVPVTGYTTGAAAATLTLPSSVTIGTADYSWEAKYYLNTTTSGYSAISTISLSGMRYGDSGFGNRLQFASNFQSAGTVYSVNQTKTTTYQQVITVKMIRKSGILKFYINGVQTNFASGTGTSYTNSQIADTYSIGAFTTITLGATNLGLISFTLDY